MNQTVLLLALGIVKTLLGTLIVEHEDAKATNGKTAFEKRTLANVVANLRIVKDDLDYLTR